MNADRVGLAMQTAKYVYWQDGDCWLGYMEEYPDYWTQGETLDDLIEQLKDLYLDVPADESPASARSAS